MLGLIFVVGQIRHATRAEIVAALPPVLRVPEKRDPAGEARYGRVVELAVRAALPEIAKGEAKGADAATRHAAVEAGRPLIDGLEKTLDGPLRVPEATGDRFPEYASLRALIRIVALATRDAVERGDRAECERDAILGLRSTSSLVRSGGDTLCLSMAVGIEAVAERSAVEADAKGGFSDDGERRVSSLLPALGAAMPESVAALRKEFHTLRMPMLVDPIHGYKALPGSEWMLVTEEPKRGAGRYDPIATARLVGRQYAAAIADSQRPWDAQTLAANRLAETAAKGLPNESGMAKAAYRKRMNALPNSLGRMFASVPPFDGMALLGTLRAARRNLARAAILLRHGERAAVPDPFGKGPLRVDVKRRIVWSVGENGKDDGGRIGKGFGTKAPDLGYRY